MKIAALLTCFNRKDKTRQCLRSLFNILPSCDVYLVDDHSSDGTAQLVDEHFPQVKLIQGTGNLFWNRGMNLAWLEAAKGDYDFYLWLNDDVDLYPNFLEELLGTYEKLGKNVIVSGVVESKDKSGIIYGGYDGKKQLINPNGLEKKVTHLNGNIVLVSRKIFQKLGNLDPFYHHDLGDVDYGLRALKSGIDVYTTKTPVASGERNSIKRERLNNATITKRFQRLYSPLGSNPNINFYFRKKHKSYPNALLYYVFQHFLNAIPDRVNRLLFGKKY